MNQSPHNPWNQRPTETDRAFRAFMVYLHLGVNRSHRAAARSFGCSARNLGDWSKKHDWVKRARDYDAHMDAVRAAAIEAQVMADGVRWAKEYQRHREEQLALGKALIDKVRQMLQFPLARKVVTEEEGKTITHLHPARWDFSSAARMAVSADALILQACSGELDPTKSAGVATTEPAPVVDMGGEEVVAAIKAVADRLSRSAVAPTP